jgi:glyoxylate/hydroxypyruvate reductase A
VNSDKRPVLAFYSRALDSAPWVEAFRKAMPELDLRVHPDLGNPSDVDVLCAFRPPKGLVASLPNLRLFQVLGAGTDHLKDDLKSIPLSVPIARLVDDSTRDLMAEYVLAAVLRHHRELDLFEAQQRETFWKRREPRPALDRTIGVLGFGELGRPVAERLKDNRFRVRAWRRSERESGSAIEIFSGQDALPKFFAGLDGVVCLLPLAPETIGILNARWLGAMNKGAFLVNVGRGQHLVEADLKELLDAGHLSGATLDVFSSEPLPADHWMWRHPRVLITPHVATMPRARTAVPFILENVAQVMRGDPPKLQVTRSGDQ